MNLKLEEIKHAYLLIVHNEIYLLKQLLEVLDDERNDIYIHIDKKVKSFDVENIESVVKKSNLFIVKRMNVTWAGDSLLKCEYRLLKAAFSKHYHYYHLLSGVDFPIKSQNYIHQFFSNSEVNFILARRLENEQIDRHIIQRNKEYHFSQNRIGRNENLTNRMFKVERRLLKLQRKFGVNRLKNCPLDMYYGAQWFSITDKLVKEILLKEKFVKNIFFRSYCPDESFINTIAMNSKEQNIEPNNCLRYIDWKSGKPHVFQLKDYDKLINSDKLFARKFTCETEDGRALISKLKESMHNENNCE